MAQASRDRFFYVVNKSRRNIDVAFMGAEGGGYIELPNSQVAFMEYPWSPDDQPGVVVTAIDVTVGYTISGNWTDYRRASVRRLAHRSDGDPPRVS